MPEKSTVVDRGQLPPLLREKLQSLEKRHDELQDELARPDAVDRRDYAVRARELGALAKRVALYREYRDLERQLRESRELLESSAEDEELRAMARDEMEALRPRVERRCDELIDALLVDDSESTRSVILEIRAGTGGDEAALFASDLCNMYRKYADHRGWKLEILGASSTPLGGFKEVICGVSGDDVFRDLRFETGGHRVQRVPETETSGRIHTSAATVAVMSEPEDVDVEIKRSDLKIDTYRSSGPGGQNVNKTSSAVRITHLPTGLVVAIQEESSQHKNKSKAMRVLASRLYEIQERERKEKEQSIRRSQIGSGDRNQRVRTYNFPQNRVTDHRLGQNFNLERVVHEGELDPLIEELRTYARNERLRSL